MHSIPAYDTIEKLTLYPVYFEISSWKVKHSEENEIDFAGNMGIISTLFEMIIYATNFKPFSMFFLSSGKQASRSFFSSAEISPIGWIFSTPSGCM